MGAGDVLQGDGCDLPFLVKPLSSRALKAAMSRRREEV